MDKIIDMVGGENRGKEGKKAVGDAAIRLRRDVPRRVVYNRRAFCRPPRRDYCRCHAALLAPRMQSRRVRDGVVRVG